MPTATLMRTASGPVQPNVAHGGRVALFGRSRSGGSLAFPQSLRVSGRDTRAAAAGSQSDGRRGSRSRRVSLEEEELGVGLERKALGVGIRSGAGVSAPEGVEEVEFAGGAGGERKGGGGRGGGKGGREGTGGGGEDSEMGAYYQEMLRADPGNPLLLRNYGKFLHEVEGDVEGAEECYGRAILASPGDGEVLSLYGKLIWDAHRDEDRAEAYFERAVEAAPDDCYVLGSYAHFLWDAEEDDQEKTTPSSSATSPSSSSSSSSQQHPEKSYRGVLL